MTAYQPLVYAPALSDSRAEHYHQNWFLCDTNFQLLPASALSRLQEVSSSIYLGRLRLQAPGMLMLELLLDVVEDDDSVRCEAQVGDQRVQAIDEGTLAHTWFSQLLGCDCLCLKVDPESTQQICWP